MGEALPLNSSAFLVLIEDKEAEGIIDSMQGYNAQVVTMTVGDQMSGEIAQSVSSEITMPAEEGGISLPTGTNELSAGEQA